MSLEEDFNSLSISSPQAPYLPQDIVERIIHESSDDPLILAELCVLSKDCAGVARKCLYRVLDLVDGPYLPSHPNKFFGLKLRNREKRRRTMQNNRHLWAYIRSLAVTLEDAKYYPNETNIRFIRVLKKIRLDRLENLWIQFGREGCSGRTGHFRVVEPAREILERLLSSEHLRALSIDIHTTYGAGNPFPGWIFRTLSPTATKLCIRTAHSSNATIFPGGTSALSGFTPSGPKRFLTTFQFATGISTNVIFSFDEDEDSMARCSTILSNLCFNFDISQVKRLEITTIWNPAVVGRTADESIWTFPNQAAEGLQELTVYRFPNTTGQLGRRPKADHFSNYRALQTLRFGLTLRGQYPDGSDDGCGALAELLSLPLPPTLHRLFIQVSMGTFFGEHSHDVFTSLSSADLSSWSHLDKAVAKHSPMSLLSIELIWSTMLPLGPQHYPRWHDGDLEGHTSILTKRQRREARRVNKQGWEDGVQAMLRQWGQMFQKAKDKGTLSLKYTHTEIPPPKMHY